MRCPNPKVIVIKWSSKMRLKRPFEVAIVERRRRPDDEEEPVALARFATQQEAEAYATFARDALTGWGA